MRRRTAGSGCATRAAARWSLVLFVTMAVVAAGAARAGEGVGQVEGAAAGEVEGAPTSDGPWHTVDVTDTTGWTLRGVSLYLAEDGQGLVVVRADGAEKALAFADVARVLDADGRDITDEVLTGVSLGETIAPAPPPFEARVAPEFAAEPLARHRPGRGEEPQLFAFALDAGGGVAELVGDWFWGLDDGGFTQAGVRLHTTGSGYVHLLYRHQQAGSRSYVMYWDGPTVDVDLRVQSFQFLYGTHTAERQARALRSLGYVEAGGGIMRVSASDGYDTEGVSRFAFAMQAGLWLRLAENLVLDAGLHGFYKPGWVDEDEAGGTELGLQLCLAYLGR